MRTLKEVLRAKIHDLVVPSGLPIGEVSDDPRLKSSANLFCKAAEKRLEDQMAVVTSLDTRVTSMLTIASTVLPITAGFLVNGLKGSGSVGPIQIADVVWFTKQPGILERHSYALWALVAGGGFYILLVIAFLVAIRLGSWDTRPELQQWQEIAPNYDEETMLWWLGNAYVEAHQRNLPNLEK